MFDQNDFKAKIETASHVYVDRKEDNSGTYVYTNACDPDGWTVTVPNSAYYGEEWLYYSENVRAVIRQIKPSIIIM